MRLLILAGLIFLLYRTVKKWMATDFLSQRTDTFPKANGQLDDLMVQDPYCGTFFLKSEGVEIRLDGKPLHFCGTKCRDDYLKQHTQEHVS